MVKRISTSLNVSPNKLQKYLEEIFFKKNSIRPSYDYAEYIIREDQFQLISDWTHFAILRLIKTKNFKPNEKWIASRLGVNIIKIREAKERLIRTGLLSISGDVWTDQSDGSTSYVKIENTNDMIRAFLKTMLQKSTESLEKDPIEFRNHSGIMITISQKSLPMARELITNFRKSMAQLLENDQEDLDQVYFLETGFFPLTKVTQTNPAKNNKE